MTYHNTFLKIIGVLFTLFVTGIEAHALVDLNTKEAETAARTLSEARSSSDSLKILLDVYDLSDKINKDKIRVELIELVKRADDSTVVKDVLSELATSTDDAGELEQLIKISRSLPDSESKHVDAVIDMEHAQVQAKNVGSGEVVRQIAEYARNGMSITGDPYEEIKNIYRALVYLGSSSQGPLYFVYIKRLEELVDGLPEKDHDLKNLFYTTAALYYTRKRDYNKAIELDRKLIKELDAISERSKESGRTGQNLDYFYYVSYRRMLRNFKGLTPEEVEDYYAKCLELAAKDEKVAKSFGDGGLTKSYYYMAKQQYAKAIPELVKALENENISKYRRRELLGHLSLAYRETGNAKGELETMRKFTDLLLEDREERTNDMYKEIEMRNTVNKIIADENRKQDQQRQQNMVMRKTSITLVYVLGIILIFLMAAYIRLRTKVKELQLRNNKLRTNIEHIFDDGVPKGTQDLRNRKNRLKG